MRTNGVAATGGGKVVVIFSTDDCEDAVVVVRTRFVDERRKANTGVSYGGKFTTSMSVGRPTPASATVASSQRR